MFYIYVLKSIKNGKRYVGMTSQDPKRRLWQHNGRTNKWTSQNAPFKLVHVEKFEKKEKAVRRERFFKTGDGRKVLGNLLDQFIPG